MNNSYHYLFIIFWWFIVERYNYYERCIITGYNRTLIKGQNE
jgi:hypothetical protein